MTAGVRGTDDEDLDDNVRELLDSQDWVSAVKLPGPLLPEQQDPAAYARVAARGPA